MAIEYTRRVPDRCRIAREEAGLTQIEAAKKLGWHVNTVRKYERNRSNHLRPYVDICRAYGISLDWLVLGRGELQFVAADSMLALPEEARKPIEQLIEWLSGRLQY